MDSGTKIYVQSIIKIYAGIQKLTGGDIHVQMHRQYGDCMSQHFLFFKTRKVIQKPLLKFVCTTSTLWSVSFQILDIIRQILLG
jgi:hypothetical protein